jgi:DNA-binding NtrC family response regulator
MTDNIAAGKNMMVVSNKPDSPWSDTIRLALSPLGKPHFITETEIMAQIDTQSYDLIIIASGDIDGEIGDLVKKLRFSCPETPIIVTTNSPTWRRAKEVFLAGATDYIRRTLDKNKILSFYQEVLQHIPSTTSTQAISDEDDDV